MGFDDLHLDRQRLSAPLPIWQARVDRAGWIAVAAQVAQARGRLLSVWGRSDSTGPSVCAAFATAEGLLWAELPLT